MMDENKWVKITNRSKGQLSGGKPKTKQTES